MCVDLVNSSMFLLSYTEAIMQVCLCVCERCDGEGWRQIVFETH